ncbi:response regulator [Paenibacillus sp. B2(2019)]|uniref:response regulator transcription factor n=1 Tax=Paenibacillus sp. B2(2019) TaxID=2607754 RepID=UPI0011F39C65|nr:response regulator [Paenibacillus sp. B2(2019)]KAA1178439.1 response regulator [Paenibacillus sp. B2(2019)]
METTKTIKVLIADDESIVRKGLRSTIPWHKYGMEVVADAPNGLKAWEAYQIHLPQIVITDIVMPEMNGIELLRKVKEVDKDTRIILLSCHRDFEFAQQGIKLGASGYLLKTAFEDEELEGMLEKFQRELTSSAPVADAETSEIYGERLGSLLFAWQSGHSSKFVDEIDKLIREKLPLNREPLYIYLIKTCGCDCTYLDLVKLNEDENSRMPHSAPVIIPYGEDLCYWIVPADELEIADSLLVQMKSQIEKLKWAKRGPLGNAEDLSKAFMALHKEAEVEKLHGISSQDWPEPIWKAVKLLHENPGADWSVSDLASQVGLSRSHFSILFKKTVGDSFVAFQYKRKLKLAKALLRDTQLTMQDIAERTGLGDSKYFSKWFKRCTGQTPSYYRIQQKDAVIRTDGHPDL